MTRRFECIGIPFIDETITGARLSNLASRGSSQQRPDGGRMITWRDSTGAIMVFNLGSDGKIVCCQPAFASRDPISVLLTGFGSNSECAYCDPMLATQPIPAELAVDHKEVRPPLVFHLANAGVVRHRTRVEENYAVSVTGFVESLKVWRNDEAFHAEHPGDHSSLFGFRFDPKDPSPSQYLVTAPVLETQERTNSETRVDFIWARVGAGFPNLEIVAAEEQAPLGLAVGNIISAGVWMSAWLNDAP